MLVSSTPGLQRGVELVAAADQIALGAAVARDEHDLGSAVSITLTGLMTAPSLGDRMVADQPLPEFRRRA